MTAVPAVPGRVVTIDRARLARMRRDTVLAWIGSRKGTVRLVVLALATALFAVPAGWPLILLVVAPPLGQVCWWWFQTRSYARSGLGVGESISVDYAASGEIGLTDATGQVWLPRGSALAVVRSRGNATVYGRSLSFVVPTEVLTDSDAAFLEGHGDEPHEPTAPTPDLPLSLTITADVQQGTVAAITSAMVRSADFWQPWVSAAVVVGIMALVGSATAVLVAALIMGGLASTTLVRVLRMRKGIRAAYPVGRTIRARVDPGHFMLSFPHGAQSHPWSDFSHARVTRHAVLLRRPRRRLALDMIMVMPAGLFDADALGTLVAAVPRRF